MKNPADPAVDDYQALAPRPLSRLSYQIMGLNLIALLILIAGIFYLNRYKQELTSAETEILATEAQLYASLIADKAVIGGRIDMSAAKAVFSSFDIDKTQRLRLFDKTGALILDDQTPGYQDASQGQYGTSLTDKLIQIFMAPVARILSVSFVFPEFPDGPSRRIEDFPQAKKALRGEGELSAWTSPSKGLLLMAAEPVSKNDDVLGAILVTRTDTKVEKTFTVMQVGVLQFFFIALLITFSFSLYLSASIGHPLRKLASAAEYVRQGRGGIESIPDFSGRHDEIGELSLSLREMTRELKERIDTIEAFSADVSHELKNPLTSMRSAFETLEKVKRDEDRQKLMGIIMHDLVRMDRLISDISRSSRVDVEIQRDILSEIDLRDAILPLIDAYRKPLERGAGVDKGAASNIEIDGLGRPIPVIGHVIRLSQVFQNLIENALSFSPPGHPIRVMVEKIDGFVDIVVEDDGPGIPESQLKKIFERFYTERPAREEFGSHSGLGLSIARQIVLAHGGAIAAENIRGNRGEVKGARFFVRLKAV